MRIALRCALGLLVVALLAALFATREVLEEAQIQTSSKDAEVPLVPPALHGRASLARRGPIAAHWEQAKNLIRRVLDIPEDDGQRRVEFVVVEWETGDPISGAFVSVGAFDGNLNGNTTEARTTRGTDFPTLLRDVMQRTGGAYSDVKYKTTRHVFSCPTPTSIPPVTRSGDERTRALA